MPPPKPTAHAAALPTLGNHFDAWNSSSTGHQRAENNPGGSTGWKQSRNSKLHHQFKSGGTGGKRISDAVGAGSEDWDEKARAVVPKEARKRMTCSVVDMLVGKENVSTNKDEKVTTQKTKGDESKERDKSSLQKGIFDGLVIYINGSTHPLVSDHKLKSLLVENGGKVSVHLGRRQVTHVILGNPSGDQGKGAGGGLARSKMEKEIRRVRGCGIKYVGVEWALESIKAGIRLQEARFSNLKVAAKGQQSVYGMFKKTNSTIVSSDNVGTGT